MSKFLELSDVERGEALRAADDSNEYGLQAYILEKDYWVTQVLKILFEQIAPIYKAKCDNPFIFKGGTSLSKGYKLINRMSEDIDLSFSLKVLDCEPIIPEVEESRNSLNKRALQIDESAKLFIENSFLTHLNTQLKKLDDRFTTSIESQHPLDIAIFYPKSLDEDEYGSAVQSRILLETGGRSENDPIEENEVNHLVGETIDELFDDEFQVIMVSPSRTLFEKAFGIHSNNIKQNVPDKHARHLYDIVQIYNHNIEWCNNAELLKNVINFCEIYYKWHKTSCDIARDEKLTLVPETEVMINKYREDWNKMEDMFYGSEFPYSYEELLEKVKLVEEEINKNY